MSNELIVTLKTGTGKSEKTRPFPISQANKLLKMSNAQWKLSDSKFKWNGTEIAKAPSKAKAKKDTTD